MSKKILIVEDNEMNRKLFILLLTSMGYQVVAATDGREGIETAARERPDLILMDIQMPEMDGASALREIRNREETRGIPVLALTAYAMVGDREKYLDQGFDGYLAKPVDRESFSTMIKGLLREGEEGE